MAAKGGGTGPGAAASSTDFYGAVGQGAESTGKWLRQTARWLESSDDTEPAHVFTWCCEDFKPRKLKAPLVLAWLVCQALGIIYQFRLYSEISANLDAYEATLAVYCAPEHRQNDICLGPAWNLSFSSVLTFPPMESNGEDSTSGFDYVVPADRTFSFKTLSQPPTFLLGVEPQPPYAKARWKVSAVAKDVTQRLGLFGDESVGVMPPFYGTGSRYRVLVSKAYHGNGEWSGSLSLQSKFTTNSDVRIFVVDSRIEHLEDVHNQSQCSFEASWQNFNERHSGQHHRVLSNAQTATGFFLLVSIATFGAMFHRFYFFVEGGKLLSRIIALKFLLQDFPQQLCIVAYLYGWYAYNGLRCQMCLFHPRHCDDEHPLHMSNFMVCFFTLLSACSNQLLVQAKMKRYDDEEELILCFGRTAMFSVSVLPFSTSVFLLSPSLFHFRNFFIFALAGIPTMIGWSTVLCMPMFAFCEDEMLV